MDSGSAIPSTSRDEFYRIPVCLPPVEVQRRFEMILEPLWVERSRLEAEIRTLADARDALLPRLLSGELSVAGAEQAHEATA